MHSRNFLLLLYGLGLLLLLSLIADSDARGGGRRGGGLFSSWRKVKKPSSSSSSGRRQNMGSHSYNNGGSLGSLPNPVKPSSQSKIGSSYPKQQLPTGATYHPSGTNLPPGATYHPYGWSTPTGSAGLPPGGAYYTNAASLPPQAVFYAQPPSSSFSTSNFLFGLYAGHVLSHGLFGPRPMVTHVYHDRPPQQGNQQDKVIIINNAGADTITTTAMPPLWPTDTEVPLAPLDATTNSGPYADPIFKKTAAEPTATLPQPVPAEDNAAGFICLPLMVNETDPHNPSLQKEVQKIACFPAPKPPENIPPAAAPAGIICVPRKEQNEEKQDCYPAPPAPEEEHVPTKSSDSVIGNIATEPEEMISSTTVAPQVSALVPQDTHSLLEALRQEEWSTMGDLMGFA